MVISMHIIPPGMMLHGPTSVEQHCSNGRKTTPSWFSTMALPLVLLSTTKAGLQFSGYHADAANNFDWSVLNEVNSDHFPVLIKWNQGVGYENQKTKTRPNYHKANWARFQEIVMESLTELAAEEVPSRKLFIFTEALKKAASMTIPLRVLRTNETP